MTAEAQGIHKAEGHSVGTPSGNRPGVKRSRVTIALDDRDDETGLPSGRNLSKAQNEVKEGKQKMTPPRE